MDHVKLIAIGLLLLLFLTLGIWDYILKSKEEKKEILIGAIIFWAKAAVYKAEKEFGGGTGELKLANVYQAAVSQFPIIAEMMTVTEFDDTIVKPALQWLNKQISSNENIKKLLGISSEE